MSADDSVLIQPMEFDEKTKAEIIKSLELIQARLDVESNNHVKNDLLLQLIELAKSIGPLSAFAPPLARPIMKNLRTLCVDREPAIRAQALRVLRYLIQDEAMASLFYALNIDLLVVRSLEFESKFIWERMQALKLVRHMMVVDPSQISRVIVQSLVAIADHLKDDFRRVSLDALRELVIVNPECVAACNGVRTIVDSILEPAFQDIAGSLTLTLLFLLDQDSTRKYLRPSVDVLKLLSVFTDVSAGSSPEREAKRMAAHKALLTIMRTWTGILCLTADTQGLRSLIELLLLPSSVKGASWTKEAVLDLLYEVLNVVRGPEFRPSISTMQLGPAYEHNARQPGGLFAVPPWPVEGGPDLLHSYLLMVLLALVDCGLVQVLTQLGTSGDPDFSTVATNLLTELLRLAAILLPRKLCAELNALPSVVAVASCASGASGSSRLRATHMLSSLYRAQQAGGSGSSTTGWMTGPAAPLMASAAAAAGGPHHGMGHDIGDGSPGSSPDADAAHLGRASTAYRDAYDAFSPSRGGGGGYEGRATVHRAAPVVYGMRLDRLIAKTDYMARITMEATGSDSGLVRRASLLDALRSQMESAVDESELNALMKKSQVLVSKDFKSWDMDLVCQLLEGPLTHHPPAMGWALKTKFCKRLLSFLKPEKRFFSCLEWNVPNLIYVRMSVLLFRALLSSQEGREYIFFNELIDDIFRALFAELGKDPKGKPVPEAKMPEEPGLSSSDALSISPSPLSSGGGLSLSKASSKASSKSGKTFRPFSRGHLAVHLARDYFTLIGILSATPYGLSVFDKYHLFDHLYSLSRDYSCDYMTRLLIGSLDYASNKRTRTLLETLVKGGSEHLRRHAISHLRVLLRNSLALRQAARGGSSGAALGDASSSSSVGASSSPSSSSVCSHAGADLSWVVGLLVSQLQHPEKDVALAALSALDEAASASNDCLEVLIKKKPVFAKRILPAARCLLHKFLRLPAGFEYLTANGWIDPQLQYWRAAGNLRYVENLESQLVAALNTTPSSQSSSSSSSSSSGSYSGSSSAAAGGGGSSGGSSDWPPGLQPLHAHRSDADNQYLERLHKLPWKVSVLVEYDKGISLELVADAYLCTAYLPSTDDEDDSGGSGSSPSSSSKRPGSGGALVAYVVAVICDGEGAPKPCRIEPSAFLKARLTVGAGPFSEPSEGAVHGSGGLPLSPRMRPLTRQLRDRSGSSGTPGASSSHLASAADPFGSHALGMGLGGSSGGSGGHGRSWASHFFVDPSRSDFSLHPEQRDGLRFDPQLQQHQQQTAQVQWVAPQGELGPRWQFAVEAGGRSIPSPSILPAFGSSASSFASSSSSVVHWMSVWIPLPLPYRPTVSVPVGHHLLGELARTEAGRDELERSGLIKELVDTVKEAGPATVAKRAALWALGHAGSAAPGLQLLQRESIVAYISDQAKSCPTLSLRGTCFYVLGLISRSPAGRQVLRGLGWDCSPKLRSGLVAPVDVHGFLSVPKAEFAAAWPLERSIAFGVSRVPAKSKGPESTSQGGGGGAVGETKEASEPAPDDESFVLEHDVKSYARMAHIILGHISNLCNHVTQKSSYQSLRQLQNTCRPLFASHVVWFEACKMLAAYTYRLPARRYILFDLFKSVPFDRRALGLMDRPLLGGASDEVVLMQALQEEVDALSQDAAAAAAAAAAVAAVKPDA